MSERIEDVEVKLAYLERHLAELDNVVRALYDEVAMLREQLQPKEAEEGPEGHEPPPHY